MYFIAVTSLSKHCVVFIDATVSVSCPDSEGEVRVVLRQVPALREIQSFNIITLESGHNDVSSLFTLPCGHFQFKDKD